MSGAAVDLFAVEANTPLAIVNEFLCKGTYVPAPEEPVAENEVIIGELNDLEKAIFSAGIYIADSNNEMVSKGEDTELKVRLNKLNHKVLGELLWACIKNRLGETAIEPDGVGIRKDYKIVSFSLPAGAPFMRALLAGMD